MATLGGTVGLVLTLLVLASLAHIWWRRRLLARAAVRSAMGHVKQGLTVALTAAVATAVVAGALVVGDSMEALVEETATEALPGIDAAVRTSRPLEAAYFGNLQQDRWWSSNVSRSALALTVPAAVTCGATGQRDGQVALWGIQDDIYTLSSFFSGGDSRTAPLYSREVAINRQLAEELGASVGDKIDLRVPNPGFWGDFLFLFGSDSAVVAEGLTVKFVFDDEGLGRIDLEAQRTPTSNCFMALDELQRLLGVEGEVNTVLMQYRDRDVVGTDEEDRVLAGLEEYLDGKVGSSGVGLVLQDSPRGWQTLASDLIFLPSDLEASLGEVAVNWSPTLTYFVDSLDGPGPEDLAYSTVAGIDLARDREVLGDWVWNASSPHTVPGPASRQALVNNWTAQVLGLSPGDSVTVGYTVVDERYQLSEREVELQVVGIVDLEGKAADPSLLPPIPGVHSAVSCLDWKPPFPIDLETIEDEDVDYWNAHKGTPKVWIDLGTARELWANPDGDWTTARFLPPSGAGNATLDDFDEAVTAADAGAVVDPVRADALDTAGPLEIFEQMFLFFGLVLLLSGCLLEASAFANLARSRVREHATLRALGLDRGGLLRMLVFEGMLWGILAALVGVAAGVGLGAGLVGGLNTFWDAAVEGASIPFAVGDGTVGLALGVGLAVTMATLYLAARRTARMEIASSLADRSGVAVESTRGMPDGRMVAYGLVLVVAPAAAGALLRPSTDIGGISLFFVAGTLVTVGAVLLVLPLLRRLEERVAYGGLIHPWRMGLRSLSRRPNRALMLVATFALVSFAVMGISWAGEVELSHAGELREEQTGGYDVLAETWVPVTDDLKGLPGAPPGDWEVTPVKVVGHQGGTCSNLNARFPPRVMGVPREFIDAVEVSFRESSVGDDRATWSSLTTLTPEGRVPVVVDYNTLIWVYGGELGEVYEVDGDRGRVHEVEVVGVMEASIFGGSFITGQDLVEGVYPDSAAYTYFLFDAGSVEPEKLARALEAGLGELGLDARPTVEVLRENLRYELSFLRLFQAYLALGLVVGALGLGALAMREVRDRRQEIGAMRALGWQRRGVSLTFLSEQVWFALAGVVAGAVGAAVAVVATSSGWLGSLSDIYFPAGAVVGIATAVVVAAAGGALLAARDAARVEAVEALRAVE